MALTRLVNLPWRLSKEQLSWLKKRMKDKRDAVRALATEQYEMRFPPRIELDELEDGFEEDFDFYIYPHHPHCMAERNLPDEGEENGQRAGHARQRDKTGGEVGQAVPQPVSYTHLKCWRSGTSCRPSAWK